LSFVKAPRASSSCQCQSSVAVDDPAASSWLGVHRRIAPVQPWYIAPPTPVEVRVFREEDEARASLNET
jgi:hypothetical protein